MITIIISLLCFAVAFAMMRFGRTHVASLSAASFLVVALGLLLTLASFLGFEPGVVSYGIVLGLTIIVYLISKLAVLGLWTAYWITGVVLLTVFSAASILNGGTTFVSTTSVAIVFFGTLLAAFLTRKQAKAILAGIYAGIAAANGVVVLLFTFLGVESLVTAAFIGSVLIVAAPVAGIIFQLRLARTTPVQEAV